jgi:hypothetical protein
MAHIGKYYRVHFRRDTCCNLSNSSFGWGCRYTWQTSGIGGTIGLALNNHIWVCTSTHGPTNDMPKWTSAPLVSGIYTLVAECTVVVSGTPQISKSFGTITEATLGLLYKVQFDINQETNFTHRVQGSLGIVFSNPPFWTKQPTSFDPWDVVSAYWP